MVSMSSSEAASIVSSISPLRLMGKLSSMPRRFVSIVGGGGGGAGGGGAGDKVLKV